MCEHLDHLVVRNAFRSQSGILPDYRVVNDQDRRALRKKIHFQPHLFVAQEPVALSMAPAWDGTGLVPRPISFRAFVVATPAGYRVMPGGLTRVGGGERMQISLHGGGSNKDTWVLADGPVEQVTLLPSEQHVVELRRVGNNLPSRLADNFYWMGRYCERGDATARLLRSALLRLNSEGTGDSFPLIEPLLDTLAKQGQGFPACHRAHAAIRR